MTYATIQVSNTENSTEYDVHEPMPYPIALCKSGKVMGIGPVDDGDYLVGFQLTENHVIDIYSSTWLNNKYPEEVVGTYPVFVSAVHGGMYNLTTPVTSARFYQ